MNEIINISRLILFTNIMSVYFCHLSFVIIPTSNGINEIDNNQLSIEYGETISSVLFAKYILHTE